MFFENVKSANPGTIRTSNIIDFTGDSQGRSHIANPGYYVWMADGKLAGPFSDLTEASQHYFATISQPTILNE